MSDQLAPAEKVAKLNSLINEVPLGKQTFAIDLVNSYKKYAGQLSTKQWYWVGKLIEMAENGGLAVLEPKSVPVGDFKSVLALFDKAKANGLKYPVIHLQVADQPVVLKLAGEKSKNPGCVYATETGKFGQGKYFGKVTQAGEFIAGADAAGQVNPGIVELLQKLAKSPERVAKAYGKMSGKCCFCHSELTDPTSVECGYGPVCADKWGLPHKSKISHACTDEYEPVEIEIGNGKTIWVDELGQQVAYPGPDPEDEAAVLNKNMWATYVGVRQNSPQLALEDQLSAVAMLYHVEFDRVADAVLAGYKEHTS